MTIAECLAKSSAKLTQAGIGTARLDALVLLEDVTYRDRAWLLANPSSEISTNEFAQLQKLLKRRLKHKPLAYVRGKTEFYGREFIITPAVLEPRPESETMIDLLKSLPGLNKQKRIADVGTGSGALGITAALELPECHVELLDIDKKALKVAKSNVDKFTLDINVQHSDLLNNSMQQNDVLLCNLPYVPDGFKINQAAMQEPKLAIYGGLDGLDIYRKLFEQITKLKNRPLYILCESLPTQHNKLSEIAAKAGYELLQTEDFIQVFGNKK